MSRLSALRWRVVAGHLALLGRALRTRTADALVLLGSAAVYLWASRPAGRYVVDDAGISFAYGMNWGRHGQLACNLEGWAAEGFSNPLTVLLVAGLSAVRAFHPLTTPGHLAAVLFALEGWVVFLLLRDALRPVRWVAWLPVALFLTLEVCTPATMIWYGSGLENGQLSLAVLVLLRRLQVGGERGFRSWLDAPILVAAALVRPEAPLFVLTWFGAAALNVVGAARRGGPSAGARVRGLLVTAVVTAALLAAFLAARYALFASLVPNTSHAKLDEPDLARNLDEYVIRSLGTYWYAFGLAFSGVALFASERLRPLGLPLALFTVASLGMPTVGGEDWMGEHRFGTAFLMLGHLAFAGACAAAWLAARDASWLGTARRALPASALVAGVVFVFAKGRDEYRTFLGTRYVGYPLIADTEGFERVRLQRYLGLIDPVVALPDAGGSTVAGSIQLVDTAYLADFHMARLRHDPDLVTQYELQERRVDLAEYHAWAFDKELVGDRFLHVARWYAEDDYPSFDPAYAVRRELVESAEPGAGSTRLAAQGGIEAQLSGRTVLLGAPGALARVELLLSAAGDRDEGCRVRVSIGADADERLAFTLSPLSEGAIDPTPGRYYRHGFLVRLPGAPGDYPVRVALCTGENAALADAPSPFRVRRPEAITPEELERSVDARAGWLESARWVAQLREQLPRRLPPGQSDDTLLTFRRSYHWANHADVGAYDALVQDSRPGFLAPLPPPVRALEDDVITTAAAAASRAWAAPAPLGQRTLAVGRVVDDLRRLGFLGVVSRAPWTSLVEGVLAANPPTAATDGGRDAYARALGLALLVPQRARLRANLARARVKGVQLEEGDLTP